MDRSFRPVRPPCSWTRADHQTVWAGVEVAGLYRSKDGGDSWTALANVGPQLMYDDIHGLAIRPGDPTVVFSTSPFGLAISTDEGDSWDHHKFPTFDPGGILLLPQHPGSSGQSRRHVRGQRQRHSRGHRRDPPHR